MKEEAKQYHHDRYNWLKSRGICVTCGEEIAIKGLTRCAMCRAKLNALRTEKLDKGLCVQCGRNPRRSGRTLCASCAEKNKVKKLKNKKAEV